MKSRNSPALCKVLEYSTGSRLDAYLKGIRSFKDHGETRSDNGPTGASLAQPRTLKVGMPLTDTQSLERAQAKVTDPHTGVNVDRVRLLCFARCFHFLTGFRQADL